MKLAAINRLRSNIRVSAVPATRCLVLMTLMLALSGTGCLSTKPGKFSEQVCQWVPLGTPAKQAEEIMTRKGFECHTWTRDNPFNPYGFDYLGCEREQVRLHDWSVIFFMEDGKVVRYGPITVDDVALKP